MKNIEVEIPKEVQKYFPTTWNGHRVYFDGVQLMVDDFENTPEFKSLKLHNSIVALGIEGIGPATAAKIAKTGLSLIELLSVNPQRLKSELLASGEFKDGRELEILIENVFALTKVELWQIIYSFGYRNCGKTISKQLANWLVKIPFDFKGLEKNVVEAFITDPDRVNEVKELTGVLLQNNVNVIKPEPPKAGMITYEMTGSYHSGTKDDFKRIVEKDNKCIHTSLKSDTTYLVCDSLASSSGKIKKAQKAGVKCVTYQEFIDIIKAL